MGPPSPSPRLLRVALPCTSNAEVLWATTLLSTSPSTALTQCNVTMHVTDGLCLLSQR